MPLKNLANADQSLIDAWFALMEGKQIDKILPTKGAATSFRQQMNVIRRLMERERPNEFALIKDYILSIIPSTDFQGKWEVKADAAIYRSNPHPPLTLAALHPPGLEILPPTTDLFRPVSDPNSIAGFTTPKSPDSSLTMTEEEKGRNQKLLDEAREMLKEKKS